MAKVMKRRWSSDVGASGLSRKDRQSCDYEAYVPDHLMGRRFFLEGEVAADVADAEAAVARLNAQATALVDTEALARILLRAEAVASSRIEGLEVGARRLLHAELVRGTNQAASDVTATEVLNNIDAMVFAVGSVDAGDPITVDLLLDTTDVSSQAHGWKTTEALSGLSKTGSAVAPTTPALPLSCHPRLNSSTISFKTYATSPAPMTFPL